LFAQQADLETLFISNYRELNDAMVADLSGLKKLTKIRFRNSGISDAAFKTIAASFPDLTVLEIPYNTLLTDSALKEVGKLKKLEKLDLTYCNFGEFGVMDIASMPNLKSVDIRGNTQIGNTGLDTLTGLPSLQALKHMSQAADDGGIEALNKAKNLTELEIQDFNITDRAGEFLKQFDKLTYLSIFRCQGFGSEGLLHLKGTKLTRLDLRDLPSLNNEGMEVFKELPSLKRLYLRELASVSDDGLVSISSLKNLENLSVWDLTNVSDKTVEEIAKLPNLKVLLIRNTGVSDASVDILLKAPKLQDLTFTNNAKVTAAGLQKLEEAKKFKKLDTKPYVPTRQ
jgi:Leucine-rich repeat (LRR) protein